MSLATGLNWYLKYVAGIHLSWNNLSQKLPEILPLPQEKIRKETSMQNRYYLNYCTYSYSMVFWDWERWEKEIDWMAMLPMNAGRDDVVSSMCVAVIFIIIMLSLSSYIFQKRDI